MEQPIKFETRDQGEEAARAELYRLLARLFYAPPSTDFLTSLGSVHIDTDVNGVLIPAWTALVNAAKCASAEEVREEYDQLFIGVAKPDVMLYGSYYLSGFLMDKPLAALRTDLAQLGLQRSDGLTESEDHIAFLCEVMSNLIEPDDILQANVTSQKTFFATHMQAWVTHMCDAINSHPEARFYSLVAALSKLFFEVEIQAFDMD